MPVFIFVEKIKLDILNRKTQLLKQYNREIETKQTF
jgi:hypothetical protein